MADPKKQTNFENCVADVNIPVGRSLYLPGASGNRGSPLCFKGIFKRTGIPGSEIRFLDGKIAEYSCRNFQDEEENRKLIKENILYHHDTLPLGEFAIGTNTTAM